MRLYVYSYPLVYLSICILYFLSRLPDNPLRTDTLLYPKACSYTIKILFYTDARLMLYKVITNAIAI